MSVLSDGSIRRAVQSGLISIVPFDEAGLQPSSYDLRVNLREPLVLKPMQFHLLSTLEYVWLPSNVQAHVHGRSSLGRLGVLVHFTAGLIDPGFGGTITLEVMALHEPVRLEPFDRIAQLSFEWLDVPAERPYAGHYQGQIGPTPSRFEHG